MKKQLISLGFLWLALLLAAPIQAEEKFEEDLHYFIVFPEQPGGEGDRVTVVEFFLYSCPHCYRLEPHLKKWLEKKPEYIDYVSIPATFDRPDVMLYAKTYYALQLMGVVDTLHDRLFDAVSGEKRNLGTQTQMEDFLAENLIDLDAYRKALGSFAVQTQIRRAAVLASHFDISGVPAIVVDGKYRTSGVEGSKLMEVTDYLIDRVREEKATN
jgi:thiol:disulfide interchange protein DsbA